MAVISYVFIDLGLIYCEDLNRGIGKTPMVIDK